MMDAPHKPKKSKKKSLPAEEPSKLTNTHELEIVESPSVETHLQKKKKGTKHGKDEIHSVLQTTVNLEECSETEKLKVKKKKKKKKMDLSLEVEENSKVEEIPEILSSCGEKEKKDSKDDCSLDPGESHMDVLNECDNNIAPKRKSKKAKKRKKEREHIEPNEINNKNSSSEKRDSIKENMKCDSKLFESSEKMKKKKKKKKHQLDNEIGCEDHVTLADDKEAEKRRKTKGESCVDSESCEGNLTTSCEKSKKKREKGTSGSKTCEENPIMQFENTTKKKERGVSCIKTVNGNFSDAGDQKKSVSETSEIEMTSNGNSQKKKRKRAKKTMDVEQEEIHESKAQVAVKKIKTDRDSKLSAQMVPPSSNLSETASLALAKTDTLVSGQPQPLTGQWHGDLFDSSERQNKFLRLLGGMKKSSGENSGKSNKLFKSSGISPKKGLFGSLVSKVGGGNAMSVSDAASLNQKLEEDYNRALDLKLSKKKGMGFGFVPDPAEGKKFHIDANKTNSIKFDD